MHGFIHVCICFQIVYGTLEELLSVDFGTPLHCLAICGEIHPLECDLLDFYRVKPEDMCLTEKDRAKMRFNYNNEPDEIIDGDELEDVEDENN